ncbi:conjugal transfer protein TraH [Orientia tsutsugamushi]|uniref:Conjugal transfer protein TraH n=1 Tax=Orientia tsutsugamushi TaxID=784 RepID=A0A2U3QS19_ORITS|nr:F pilus assembly TraH domain protein [Orientia tsutsugamushi str. UT76]KJV71917.1 F pilus assembly TraH domain protein [Orientia tsutsugamushi str. UT76]SPR03742.1 conjugal transfer protein TraH [Orientia tsutsugamushi]
MFMILISHLSTVDASPTGFLWYNDKHGHDPKALFATALPRNWAMREAVCRDIQSQSGFDYFAAGKKCRNDLAQKQALRQAQNKDSELMLE